MNKKIVHVSKYKNYFLAKNGKIGLANLADYFITFIITFLIFIILGQPLSYLIASPSLNQIDNISNELYTIVDETRLSRKDVKTNKLVSEEELANEYLYSLIKTSYYLNDEQYYLFKDDGTYTLVDVDFNDTLLYKGVVNENGNYNYPNDNISYYFYTFKNEHESLDFYIYDGVDQTNNKEEYLYKEILDYKNQVFNDKFLLVDNSYPLYQQLDIKIAKYLVQYLHFNDNNDQIYRMYVELKNSYINGLNKLIEEMHTKYDKYVECNNRFNSYYLNFTLIYLGALVISYILALVILEIIVPLVSKNNTSISFIIFKIAYATKDEDEPRIYQYIIKSVTRFIMYFSSTVLCLFFVSNFQMLSFPLVGSFSYLTFAFISLIIALCSILFIIISKNNQGLAETLSFMIVKDTTLLEVKEENKKDGK